MAKSEQTEQGKKFSSPIKAIRTHCGNCIGGGLKAVEDCTSEDCDLYAYRLGKNPFGKKREMSEEQRQAASERFKKMWADKKETLKKKIVKKIAGKDIKKATKKK